MAGNCDNGYSCAYAYNMAWRTETQPLPPISDPAQSLRTPLRNRYRRSRPPRMPAASPCARAFSIRLWATRRNVESNLGTGDRRKLDEYLTSVREIEQQVQRAEKDGLVIDPGMEKPYGVPPEFPDYFRLMTDMLIVAFKTDSDPCCHAA